VKKNVASQVVGAQMVSATDGSAFTGSVTCYVTGDGGTQAAGSVGSGACTHEGNGFHTYAPAQAETNYDHVAFTFTGTGAVPATVQIYTSFPQTGDNYARLGAPVGASIAADIAGVQSDTNDIQTRIPAALVSGRIDASVGAMASGVVTATAIAADAIGASELAADAVAEIADAVWDEVLSGHLTAGSTGEALNASGSAGDPWTTALPGAYSAGQAGYILGTNLNATVSSRLASASYTAPLDAAATRAAVGLASANLDTQLTAIDDYLDTEIAAIKAKTDNLPAAPAAVGDIPTAVQNADALLGRNVSGGSSTGRTVSQALHFLRNKWTVSGGTLTVYDTDDTTSSWTATVTGTAGADPVTGSDPA